MNIISRLHKHLILKTFLISLIFALLISLIRYMIYPNFIFQSEDFGVLLVSVLLIVILIMLSFFYKFKIKNNIHIIIFFGIILSVACSNKNDSSTEKEIVSHKDTNLFLKKEAIFLADGFDFPVGNKDGKGSYISLIDNKKYDSWYVAVKTGTLNKFGIHTGEDWTGSGGGNTDLGQNVYVIGNGIVIFAQNYPAPLGNVIVIQHKYLENDSIKRINSLYIHLKDMFIEKGDTVKRREKIGTIGTGGGNMLSAHLHLEIRKQSIEKYPVLYWPSLAGKDKEWIFSNYEKPTEFINSHRKLKITQANK